MKIMEIDPQNLVYSKNFNKIAHVLNKINDSLFQPIC